MTNAQVLLKSQSFKLPPRKSLAASSTLKKVKFPLLLVLLHAPLGIALYNSSALALLHPCAAFLLGLFWALREREKLEKTALAAAYIVGCEVLWRMAEAPIYWESGKYATGAIMIVALVRRKLWKIPIPALLYFMLLLPACLPTIFENNGEYARELISFNLSGPFLLAIGCWFFSHLKIEPSQLKKLLQSIVIPLMSVAVTTLFYTVTTKDITFSTNSNFATSGGFGPNQVSAMLGLGAFLCVTCFLLFKNDFTSSICLGALAVLFVAQSMMTFSRGGMYNAVGALTAVVIFQMRNLRQGVGRLIPILGIALIFVLMIFPYLNDFTEGNLLARFELTSTTNRAEIAESDWQTFLENPLLGVGVGQSETYRAKFLAFEAASHTEFARLVSEHGSLGIGALAALFVMALTNLKKRAAGFGKALAGGLIVWSSLFMLNAGMRLAAPAFIWSLSFATTANRRQN